MMIRDDNIDIEGFRISDCFDISRSTIHGYNEFYLFFSKFIEEIFLESIAIMNSVGETIGYFAADFREKFKKESRRADAIHIIVSENNDTLSFFPCEEDAIDCLVHIGHQRWVVKVFDFWFKKMISSNLSIFEEDILYASFIALIHDNNALSTNSRESL